MKIKYVFFIAVLTVLFFQPLKVNAAENQYLELYYEFGLREDTSQIYDGWYYSDWDGLQRTCVFDNNYTYALLRSDYVKNNVTVGYTYTIYCGTIGGSYSSPYVSTNNSVSAVPIKQYYRNSDDVPNGKYTNVPTDICTWNTELYPDLLPATEYSYMYISHNTNLPIFTNTSDLANYYATGDKSGQIIDIDWDNMQYNETIGFLQNVMLKASGSLNKDFEITWSNNDWQFQNDEFRVQIGYHTRFQETLFGELRLYTDLDYISWNDGLYYSAGKWSCNVDDLFTAIPNCNHPAYTGNFYLRIVRVNSSTGSVEYGPWGQLSWVIHKSPDDGGRAVSSEYVTLKNSNVFGNDGVTDLYDEQYEIDSDSPTSQKYVVNTNNGSIDSFSTSTYDTLYNEFGELDFSKIGDYFTTGISSLYNSLHDFPTLVSKVASFLPKEIYAIIGISIVVIILCRVFGR